MLRYRSVAVMLKLYINFRRSKKNGHACGLQAPLKDVLTHAHMHTCTHAHTHTRMQIIQSLDAQNKLYRTFKIEILENNLYKDMDITLPRAKSESRVCIIQDVFEINILYEFKE